MCRTTSMPDHVNVASCSTEIWLLECPAMSTFREVWTPVIAFLEENLKNWAQKSCRSGPYYHYQPSVLSSMAKCQRKQTWNFRNPVTSTLTLDRVKVISTCTLCVGLPACLTMPCDSSLPQYRNMAIWISWNLDILRSLNSRDSFPRRKFQNRLWQAVDQVPYCQYQPLVLSSTSKWRRR